MKRALLAILAGTLLLPLSSARVGAQAQPLNFFTNYFITGDYEVGGTSLWRKGVNGRATTAIQVDGVPAGVDIVAAFLYVQTAERVQWSGIDHATFNGIDLGPGDNSIAKALNWEKNMRPCWSVAFPGGRRLVTYRADVLRFLPIVESETSPNRGKFDLSQPLPISVPDWGYAFGDDDELGVENPAITGARAVGASLVVVYRDPTKPYRGIVIYDGGHTKQAFDTMVQGIAGYYQAAANPAARLTAIVGDGRPYLSERLRVNNQNIATNPFNSGKGPKWDNPTFALPSTVVGANSAGATVEITSNGLLSDCVSTSAMVMSVNVQDSDDDGLLDVWETAGAGGTAALKDPNNQPLPLLGAMGANPQVQDLFIEVGAMTTAGDTTYGAVTKEQHSHLPGPEALKLMGDAFAAAPTGQISVHFDMGPGYAATYDPLNLATTYLVPASLARGGETLPEQVTVCQPPEGAEPFVCQFSQYPGTVGWKSGYRFLRDQVTQVNGVPAAIDFDETLCGTTGYACTRRFDPNRQQSFHYALFAHAVGLPKEEDPAHPDFHVPRTNTGIGDFPGGDVMITLGAFDDAAGLPTGTPFMQASTLMHELGHNLELRHGGGAFEPNCKPTYFSAMNYLYQLRGLLDDGGAPHLDFSNNGPAIGQINEAGLPVLQLQPYRLGWYAPLATSNLKNNYVPVGSAPLPIRYCNGATFEAGPPPVMSVRIDASTKAETIDWLSDGDGNPASPAVTIQDVNFDGKADGVLGSFDDWGYARLNQIGGRRNIGALFNVPGNLLDFVGPLSVNLGKGDLGKGDLGKGDLGKGDLGKGDLGKGDLGKGDLGKGDLGKGDLGKGDLGKGDLGGGDLFDGDPDNPGGELDFETFVSMGNNPAYEVAVCVVGQDCPSAPPELQVHDVLLNWTPAGAGVQSYAVYRFQGAAIPDETAWGTPIGVVDASILQLVDASSLLNGQQYTYWVVALYASAASAPSNPVTIIATNDPLLAGDDGYSTPEDTELNVAAPGVLANDLDADDPPPTAVTLVSGPTPNVGALTLNANGSFKYVPLANFNGAVTFTYKAGPGDPTEDNVATVTITVTAANDVPVAVNDGYSMNQGGVLTVPAVGVLANDTDVDAGTSLTAGSLVQPGEGKGTVVLNTDGSFTYTPPAAFSGVATFKYRANDGTVSSNEATVTITVNAVGYTLLPVKNLVPPPGVSFKPNWLGTLVEFQWKFSKNGAVIASGDAEPSVTITGPGGYNQTFTPSNCWLFGFLFEYSSSSKVWTFRWIPKNPALGNYAVTVKSGKTNQSFGGYQVVFKN